VLWQDDFCRVVLVDEPHYPGFVRVILNQHVREMTDLVPEERSRLMMMVCKAEKAIRDVMQPDKINLASLGNVVPHLHWHVIPRFEDDPHFPKPVWGAKLRDIPHATPADLGERLAAALQMLLGTAPGA
jgi:diadenosine tetraphosphate (Ap4A) HIT family hydrolase